MPGGCGAVDRAHIAPLYMRINISSSHSVWRHFTKTVIRIYSGATSVVILERRFAGESRDSIGESMRRHEKADKLSFFCMTFFPPESLGDPPIAIGHLEAICALTVSGVGRLLKHATFWCNL